MAYQQYLHAPEQPETILIDGTLIVKALLAQKIVALHRGIFIPDSLIAEIEQFSTRNCLSQIVDAKHLSKPLKEACPHCLKAHTLKHASLMGLPKESLSFLDKLLPGNNGHHGYYMDKGNLFKIEEE